MAERNLHIRCAHPAHPLATNRPLAVWTGDLTRGQTPPALVCDDCMANHGHPGPVPPVATDVPPGLGLRANPPLP